MKSIPNQQLDAFVDGQLDQNDRIEILDAMAGSGEIRDRVAETRRLKDLVRLAYLDQRAQSNRSSQPQTKYTSHVVAAVLGALSMLFLMQLGNLPAEFGQSTKSMEMAGRGGDSAFTPARSLMPEQVLFHLSSGDQQDGRELLDQVELVASEYEKTGRDLRVIVVTNNEGLRLYQAGYSDHADRIHELYARYDNIVFAACGTTLGKRIETGEKVELLPQVIVVDSGVAEITRRQQQGWKYIRI
jgi:intracellular sulfur oxidation DsrE/DsrF family protein